MSKNAFRSHTPAGPTAGNDGQAPAEGRPDEPGSAGDTGVRQDEATGQKPREIGGPKGPDPTRYGDWEINGRCIDF